MVYKNEMILNSDVNKYWTLKDNIIEDRAFKDKDKLIGIHSTDCSSGVVSPVMTAATRHQA